MQPQVEIREFLDHPYRYASFGYPTVLKYLFVGGKYYRPDRCAEREAMVYRDIVAIFHAPFSQLPGNYTEVYGQEAKRLIWVAALQRLGNGVAVRLLRDAEFRRLWEKRHRFGYDIKSDHNAGGSSWR